MAFEDGAVLGECLSRLPNHRDISKKSAEFLQLKRHALNVFQKCRKQRTQMVVERGNIQQYLYHLHDGPEQEERDRKMQMVPTPEGEALAWRDPGLAPKLLGYDHIADVSLIVTVVVGLELTCLGQYELGQHRRRRGKACKCQAIRSTDRVIYLDSIRLLHRVNHHNGHWSRAGNICLRMVIDRTEKHLS